MGYSRVKETVNLSPLNAQGEQGFWGPWANALCEVRVGVYSVDKLIGEARRLASEYRRATGQPLAGVSAKIAEHDAAAILNLELCQNPQLGYDAVGRGEREGQRIQIKGRTIYDEKKRGQRIGQLKLDQEWDLVVLVLLDKNHEAYEIYEADRGTVVKALEPHRSSNRAKRGAMSVAKFRSIGRRVWVRDQVDVEAQG